MSALRARKPTGMVAWPFLLVEGDEKSGKSALSFRLSASPKVGRTFVFDLGEGTADEYAELGPYEVVDHDGTFTSLIDQMRAAAAVPPHEGRPNCIILDDGTVLWDLLKDWAGARARRSKKAQDVLRRDPDAEIDVPMNLWNDASERWGQVINLLRTFPGIGIMIARGKEVTAIEGGQPTRNKEWRVEVQKGTMGAASAWVRCMRPHSATLVGVRHLRLQIPNGGQPLPNETLDDNPLEHLIFGVLGAGGFVESQRVIPSLADMPANDDEPDRAQQWPMRKPAAKQRLLGLVNGFGMSGPDALAVALELWATTGDPVEVTEEEWAALAERTTARLTIPDNPEFDVDGDGQGDQPLGAVWYELAPKVQARVKPSKAKVGAAVKDVVIALNALGVTEDDYQRAVLSVLLGREVHSRRDLTTSEGAAVVAQLAQEVKDADGEEGAG